VRGKAVGLDLYSPSRELTGERAEKLMSSSRGRRGELVEEREIRSATA